MTKCVQNKNGKFHIQLLLAWSTNVEKTNPYPQTFVHTLPFLVILPIRKAILLKELSIALLNSRELDISSRFPRVSASLSPSFFPKTTRSVIIVSTNESMGRLPFFVYQTKWLFLFQLFVSFKIQIISSIIILGAHVLWLVFITKAQWTFCGFLSAFVVLEPFKCNHKNISHRWGKAKYSSYLF